LCNPGDADEAVETDLLRAGDLLTDRVTVWGTSYKVGQLVVTDVICQDIIEVGVIEKVVVRGKEIKFLVALHECARDSVNIYQSVPLNKGKLVSYSCLPDFKPIVKRGQGKSFRFILHHYLPMASIPC
jgi:hypothetical protein